uniref:Uncharacterized protein n=1 Tax=Anguilla anguilla TaxID=7936 RepID=A0A0E9Q8D1_ANGAN
MSDPLLVMLHINGLNTVLLIDQTGSYTPV